MKKSVLFSLLFVLVACGEKPGDDDELLLHVPSPDWRDQVIYMLFIDRFDDGDPANNDQGFGEYDPAQATHFSGGDLQGVINRVDYLKDLGVTAVWVSPPVANQWWSTPYQATGWHGYWATNFKEVDAHFGTLDDYRRLSHELHSNGMYLIQDIVGNHVGNFYAYEGEYNPDDTAENFVLLEPESHQPAPDQHPFNMVDRNNPEHAAANIYHWTPMITDYDDPDQVFNYTFGFLGDLNTENPVVIEALQESYKHWVAEVGVDGFRIDTVQYVPLEFWSRLFHDPDGIYPFASELGKEFFLTFGEALLLPSPFDDSIEHRIVEYLGSDEKPGLNSMLGFPVYFDINNVIAKGQPTAQLEYRLNTFMEVFPDPFVIPNFVDNHDTARFLAAGHGAAFRQALATVFTIPGIPVIYQGTEQGLPETRMAMFAGGHRNAEGSFNPESDYYRYIQELTALRRKHKVLTRGDLQVVAADSAGPGIFAYRRDYEGDTVYVVLNTADHSIIVKDLAVDVAPHAAMKALFSVGFDAEVVADSAGNLDLVLPERAVLVLEAGDPVISAVEKPAGAIGLDPLDTSQPFAGDFVLSGEASAGGIPLQLIVNGNLDRPVEFAADERGKWEVSVPVRNLGKSRKYLFVYAPETGWLSNRIEYTTEVTTPEISLLFSDAVDDGFGPTGEYTIPGQVESGQQREIVGAAVNLAGNNLELRLEMAEVSDPWGPPLGFDNVAFTIFIDLPDEVGVKDLPLINATMPAGKDWDLAHFARGWETYTYRSRGSHEDRQGEKLGVAPPVTVDKNAGTVAFIYEGDRLGVDEWRGAAIYVTTWDATGEGVYVDLQPEPSEWFFGGAEADAPKIMDDLLIEVNGH